MTVTLVKYHEGKTKILYIYYKNIIYNRYIEHSYNFDYIMFPYEEIILTEKEFEAIQSEDQVIKNMIFDILELKYKTW